MGPAKTRELMHDGSEMTTTGRDCTDTGGVKVIKRYQNNLNKPHKKVSIGTQQQHKKHEVKQ